MHHRLPALALALIAVACGRAAVPVARGTAAPEQAPASASAPASPRAPAPRAARGIVAGFDLSAAEPAPVVKRLAVRVATALTTYAPGESAATVAARVTSDPLRRRALATAMTPLVHAGTRSRGTVVYPQLGGLTQTQASVMVVVRQVAGARAETRVLDVRVVRSGRTWVFDALASAGGVPVARPASLSAAARAVLDDPRIVLPDSARWDVHRGAVSDDLLRVMAALAERAPYAVTVLETGHPHDVFATGRTSAHTVGRAVDVWAFGGARVADLQEPGSAAFAHVEWALARGDVRQVGSPWDVDGASRRSFANTVHLDHLHVAV